MLTLVWQILAVAIVFTTIVGVHEFGHFLFAKLFKMDVDEFAIGFGPRIASRKTKTGTVVSLRCIPLGGFVRVKGSEPREDGGEVHIERGFFSRGPWLRLLVFLAGPAFSLLFGVVCYFAVAMFNGTPDAEPIIGGVPKDYPAEAAGLREGDKVLAINGAPIRTYQQIRETVQPSKAPLDFRILRGGKEVTLKVAPIQRLQLLDDADGNPKFGPDGKPIYQVLGFIGIQAKVEKFQIVPSMQFAARNSMMLISQTVHVMGSWSRLKQNAGGPISIARVTSSAAQSGAVALLYLAGTISFSLGLLNLLPIPLLDGGQIVIAFIEGLRRGRRLSMKVQELVAGAGFALILLMIVGVFALDIGHITEERAQKASSSQK